MKRICLNRNQVFRGNLILVNKNHPIRKEGGITRIGFPESEEEMEWRAGEALLELLRAVDREEELALISGFRRKTEQRKLYAESLRENGEEFTAKFVAMPGCSEHETGLAIDLGKKGGQIDLICPDFPYSGICQEFRKRAPEFGFVERYPEGKEAVPLCGGSPCGADDKVEAGAGRICEASARLRSGASEGVPGRKTVRNLLSEVPGTGDRGMCQRGTKSAGFGR